MPIVQFDTARMEHRTRCSYVRTAHDLSHMRLQRSSIQSLFQRAQRLLGGNYSGQIAIFRRREDHAALDNCRADYPLIEVGSVHIGGVPIAVGLVVIPAQCHRGMRPSSSRRSMIGWPRPGAERFRNFRVFRRAMRTYSGSVHAESDTVTHFRCFEFARAPRPSASPFTGEDPEQLRLRTQRSRLRLARDRSGCRETSCPRSPK